MSFRPTRSSHRRTRRRWRGRRELLERGAVGTFHAVGPRILPRPEFARVAAETFGLPTALLRPQPTAALALAAARTASCGLRDDKLRAALGHSLLDPGAALAEMRASEPAG